MLSSVLRRKAYLREQYLFFTIIVDKEATKYISVLNEVQPG